MNQENLITAEITRPLEGPEPYFSDTDLQQLLGWVFDNIKDGNANAIIAKSVIEDKKEKIIINLTK